jgi:hypothetical protein
MAKLLPCAGACYRAAPHLALMALLVCPLVVAGSHKKSGPAEPPHVRATLAPAVTIPVEPLGFSAPAPFYLGTRNSLVSLDFLDEEHLLFTFRIPGLIHRDHHDASENGNERKVRALVLHLPDGAVQAEAVWTLHDRRRYLWMLDNGQFLLRDREELKLGDANLQLKPFLRFPGPVLWVEMDPSRQYVVTGSTEPPTSASSAGDVSSPTTAAPTLVSDNPKPGGEDPNLILRILSRNSGKVLLVSHVQSAVHLPLNEDGFLETLRGNGKSWVINLAHFEGGSTPLGSVDSFCSPVLDFVSPREFLATTCQSDGDPHVIAMTTGGRRLWENGGSGSLVWPVLVASADGLRIARETLAVSHGVNAFAPLGTEDIKGQDVQVFDAATGKVVLRAQASPIFDIGGNVALTGSGRRVAILMAEGLQIFDLPPASPLPSDSAMPSKH